jgi:hypothetical protein
MSNSSSKNQMPIKLELNTEISNLIAKIILE